MPSCCWKCKECDYEFQDKRELKKIKEENMRLQIRNQRRTENSHNSLSYESDHPVSDGPFPFDDGILFVHFVLILSDVAKE